MSSGTDFNFFANGYASVEEGDMEMVCCSSGYP